MEKVQFMIQVDETERDRLDALRIVMGISRAEVGRRGWREGGLDRLEYTNRARLDRLKALATRAGADLDTFVRTQCTDRKIVPALEVLEALQRERDGEATRPAVPLKV